ncbi:MAG TPA: hypothetical protein VJK02_01010 [Anaerolineales bacterium]|nr:hypothetical protein [Anaerolineales bacterium]
MTPEHRHAEVGGVIGLDVLRTKAEKGNPGRLEEAVEIQQDEFMLDAGDMKDGVERTHAIESVWREGQLHYVLACEVGGRDKLVAHPKLGEGEVDPHDAMGVGEEASHRDAGAATGIEYEGVPREEPGEVSREGKIGGTAGPGGKVPCSGAVVAFRDNLRRILGAGRKH